MYSDYPVMVELREKLNEALTICANFEAEEERQFWQLHIAGEIEYIELIALQNEIKQLTGEK